MPLSGTRNGLVLFTGLLLLSLGTAAALQAQVPYGDSDRFTSPNPLESGAWESENFEVIGYTDVDGHIPFKILIQEVDDRWYLYGGNFWTRGWSITDVTDPANPQVVKIVEAPGDAQNSSTVQMDWVEGRMLTPVGRISGGRDFDPSKPYAGGFLLWDNTDPVNPRLLGHWESPGTHRNWYDGGRYVHAPSSREGYDGRIYHIIDVSDPANPVEAGRWWVEGQHVAGGETPLEESLGIHGPPMVVGDLSYVTYGSYMIVLDVSDPANIEEVGRLQLTPPFTGGIPVHTVFPIVDRGIAIVNSEAIAENCQEGAHYVGIVDISDPSDLSLLSLLPTPMPPEDSPYDHFCEKGARFGPHNVPQRPDADAAHDQGDILFVTYFNAGVRAFDISDPRAPREVGYFIPPDPFVRHGPVPSTRLVTQTQDVVVDRRGYIYITHRNQGVWILRYTGPKADTL